MEQMLTGQCPVANWGAEDQGASSKRGKTNQRHLPPAVLLIPPQNVHLPPSSSSFLSSHPTGMMQWWLGLDHPLTLLLLFSLFSQSCKPDQEQLHGADLNSELKTQTPKTPPPFSILPVSIFLHPISFSSLSLTFCLLSLTSFLCPHFPLPLFSQFSHFQT